MNTDQWQCVLSQLPTAWRQPRENNAVFNRAALVCREWRTLCTTAPIAHKRVAWKAQAPPSWCRNIVVGRRIQHRCHVGEIARACPHLEYLSANFTEPIGFLETLLRTCRCLTTINWRGFTTTSSLPLDFSCAPPSLTSLDFSQSDAVTDAALESLVCAVGPGMRELHLFRCQNVHTSGILAVTKGCPNLITLNLSGREEIDDEWVRELACAPRLEELQLACCPRITNTALALLLARCPRLIVLDLYSCPGITSVDTTTTSSVQKLDLSCCNLDSAAVCRLPTSCPRLTWLNLRTNEGVDEAAVDYCWHKCKELETIVFY